MRHHKNKRKFGRTRSGRVALMRSLATSLIRDEAITTTEAKAKELRPYVEKLVTKAKTETLASRRYISSQLGNNADASKKLIEVLAPKHKDRQGGYTRITKLPLRKSDVAKMAHISFV